MTEQAQAVQRITGRCERWLPHGCGFILAHDGGKRFYVHERDLIGVGWLRRGMTVQFTPVPRSGNDRNDRAVNVEVYGC